MDTTKLYPIQVGHYFNVFFRIQVPSCSNLGYIRTSLASDKPRPIFRNHVYEKVSTPAGRLSRFQQKGLIVVWPQRKRLYNRDAWTLFTWFLAQIMYLLYVTSLLPCGCAVELRRPPWDCRKKVRKPVKRDFIIEPDWNSLTM